MSINSVFGSMGRIVLSVPQVLIFIMTFPVFLTTAFQTMSRLFNLLIFAYRFFTLLHDCGIDPVTLLDRINKVQECLNLVKKLNDKVECITKRPLDAINSAGSGVQDALTGVANKLPGALKPTGSIGQCDLSGVAKLPEAIIPTGSNIQNGLSKVTDKLPEKLNPIGSGVQNGLSEVANKLPEKLNPIGSGVQNGLSEVANKLPDKLIPTGSGILGGLSKVTSQLPEALISNGSGEQNESLDVSCEMAETLRSSVPNSLLNVTSEVSLSSILSSPKVVPPPPPPPSVDNFKFASTPNPVFLSRADCVGTQSTEETSNGVATRCKKQRLFNEDLIQQRKLLRKITKNSTPVQLKRSEKSTEEQTIEEHDDSLGEILKSALKRKFANVNDVSSSINESISLSQDFSL